MKVLRRDYAFAELYVFRKSILGILTNYRKLVNFILVRISSILKLDKNLGMPVNVLIEPTGECNYSCIKCEKFTDQYRDDGLMFGTKSMPFDSYCRIIDELADGLVTLRLWHYGEPLINKNIVSMVKYAKGKGIFVVISSNLSLLDESTAEGFIKSGLDYLIVSFDGASEYTYKRHHGKNFFNTVVRNIETLVRIKRELGSEIPFIELQFIVMKENEAEINEISSLAKKMGVNRLAYQKIQADRLDVSKIKDFSSIEEIMPSNKNYIFSSYDKNRIKFCRIPWEETVIRYSGLVIPCAVDIGQLHAMGRLFSEGFHANFRSIWNNQNYRDFRKKIAKGLETLPNCAFCEKRNNNCNDQIDILKQ